MRRIVLALIAGGLLCLAFPTFDVWVAAPVALGLLGAVVTGVRVRTGFGLGFLAGLAFFVPTLQWSGIYVGALPWFALSGLEALYLGLAGALMARMTKAGRARPLVWALIWVVTEGLRARTPYGGFPWLKIAFSQADSPFGPLVALGGAPFVGFAVALAGGLLAVAAQALWSLRRATDATDSAHHPETRWFDRAVAALGGADHGWVRPAVPAAVALVIGASGLLVPLPTQGQNANFVAVQGNVPHPGLDFNAERRAVLDNHVRGTLLAHEEQVEAGLPDPDLYVWPENASDIDPIHNADAASLIDSTVTEINRPLVVGGLVSPTPETLYNVSLLYEPGEGVVDSYAKRHPVPFAEYIPGRAFWRLFSDKVDLVSRDFSAGTRVGVFDVTGTAGQHIRLGLAICFEVAYDDIVRDTVTAGANVLAVQTNNATFGFTAESPQQLAISRIRAMEHGRSVVHVSTVGQSALITPDGTAHQVSALFTEAVLRGDLPLRNSRTVATRVGDAPEWIALGALVLLGLVPVARRRLRPETTTSTPTETATDPQEPGETRA